MTPIMVLAIRLRKRIFFPARTFVTNKHEHQAKPYAVHGAVLIKALPTDETRGFYKTICEVFVSALSASATIVDSGYAILEFQAVTAWPIKGDSMANSLNRKTESAFDADDVCGDAISNIDPDLYQVFVNEAVTVSGADDPPACLENEGPHLIAWSNQIEALLLIDLSTVQTEEQARKQFAKWETEILDVDSWKRNPLEIVARWANTLGAKVAAAVSGEDFSIRC